MTLPATRPHGFDLIRLIAAVLVIFGHAYPLTGHVAPAALGNAPHTLGVKVFFVISGYLISGSWLSSPDPFRYLARRAARIMPGLIVVTLGATVVLGPVESTLPTLSYFSDPATPQYLWNIGLWPVYELPGVFAGNPYPRAVNGSLWTIPVEVALYLAVPVMLAAWHFRSARPIIKIALIGLAATCFYIGLFASGPSPVIYGTPIFPALGLAAYFAMGLIVRLFSLGRGILAAAAAGLLALVAFLFPDRGDICEGTLLVCLPVMIIWAGNAPLSWFGRVMAGADFSYGLYLFAFPTQQAVNALFGSPLTPLANVALSLPVISILAIASWYLVERPALRLRPRHQFTRSGA